MSNGGVFDVGHIDQVMAIADAAKLACPSTIQEPWDQMPIPRSPDQVRTEGTCEQAARAVSRKHLLLGQCLRMRIMAEPAARIGSRFVHAALIPAIKGDARAARI